MRIHASEWFLILMAVVFFATGIAFYPYMPAQVASHWNAAGQVNGTLPRAWGVFIFPIIFVIVAALLMIIPRVDPKRENIKKFRKPFGLFLVAFSLVLYYFYLLTLMWSVSGAPFGVSSFNLMQLIIPPLAALIYIIGMILPETEPNWTIGIRTPWTISSPTVWRKTHRVGGVVLRIAAVIGFFGVFFSPQVSIWFLIAPILVSALGLVIYSYVVYEKERK
jgi:uncharacterized membrane protein